MKTALLIYPHQLFEDNKLLQSADEIYLIEEPLFFTQYLFHKQKLILHRASMKNFQEYLSKLGYNVKYLEFGQLNKTSEITTIMHDDNIKKVIMYDPVDYLLEKRLASKFKDISIDFELFDTPMFLTSKFEINNFFNSILESNKKILMNSFYIWQRKKLNILVENEKPVGGKWSYDDENRKKIPKSESLPTPPLNNANKFVIEAKNFVEQNFKSNYGEIENFFYPVTHQEAKIWFQEFLESKFNKFGDYEDAMIEGENLLFHSILSPLLNIGLLTPKYVVEETLKFAKLNNTPLNSLEGFIRQIIGWREYIRAIYILKGVEIRNGNYFNAQRKIPDSFWNGTTGIVPIDDTIKQILQSGYSHHITRLMVLGNFMSLAGYKPNDVYKWFMEMYIDSYDWVMVANVYSMALYADGGLITSKPYISGSNYIFKMSNYKKGEWSTIWDALFWSFVGEHYDKLSSEGRLGYIGILYSKMDKDKIKQYALIKNKFLN